MVFRKTLVFSILLWLSQVGYSQIKQEFQKQLAEDSARRDFEHRLLGLNKLLKNGVEHLNLDSLKKDTGYYFIEKRLVENRTVLYFDLTWSLKEVYDRLEETGKVNTLKALRLKGTLKIIARGIANEVELPKKTNPRQSYNDFYLEVIRKLLLENREVLQADRLDFPTYQLWEKEARLLTTMDIRRYRENFILFLYKHYNL